VDSEHVVECERTRNRTIAAEHIVPAIVTVLREHNDTMNDESTAIAHKALLLALCKGVCFKSGFSGVGTQGHDVVLDGSFRVALMTPKKKRRDDPDRTECAHMSAVQYDQSVLSLKDISDMQDAFTSGFIDKEVSDAFQWFCPASKQFFIQLIKKMKNFGSTISRTFFTQADKVHQYL
jgi:hypothetical protein